MKRLLPRLLSIGAHPADDDDLRLRKVLVLAAVVMVGFAAIFWGAVYWVFGETVSALVPWTYVVIAAVTTPVFAITCAYRWFASTHFVVFLVLPFLLMWSLGGFVPGSVVALWAWLSPLAARSLGHRRAALLLFVAFAAGIGISALLQPGLGVQNSLSDTIVAVLFVLNVVVVAAITLILVDASSGGREGSLAALRSTLRHYFSPDVADAVLADPGRQALGGEIAEVTILFADLGGYTAFSEQRSPHQVVELLNALFGMALPVIQAHGGTPVQLPGDAVMAIFGAPRQTPGHARSAAHAALEDPGAGAAVCRRSPDVAALPHRDRSPGRPLWGTSAARSSATSRPSGTRSTWHSDSRRSPHPARSSPSRTRQPGWVRLRPSNGSMMSRSRADQSRSGLACSARCRLARVSHMAQGGGWFRVWASRPLAPRAPLLPGSRTSQRWSASCHRGARSPCRSAGGTSCHR